MRMPPSPGEAQEDLSSRWRVQESERAEAEREQATLNIAARRGPEYAQRWHQGLLQTLQDLAATPPGPRAWRRVLSEERLRRMEVRLKVYTGPDRRPSPAASYCILYAVIDPAQEETRGTVLILRLVHAAGEEAGLYQEEQG